MPALAQYGIEKYLPLLRGLYRDRAKYLAFGKGQVMARAKENGYGESGRRDIFSYLLHAQVSLHLKRKTGVWMLMVLGSRNRRRLSITRIVHGGQYAYRRWQ